MRGHALLFICLCLIPNLVSAYCSNEGATVIYVNGILTNLVDAQNNLFNLEQKFWQLGGDKNISFRNGYNSSHLDGYGDKIQSVAQTFGSSVSNFDLNTILNDIAPEVTTRKILLVGHSQGTFYTNEMYNYLIKNGVPPQSITVYNIATPASYVAGNGAYLTSANDRLINQVRIWDAEAGAAAPLSANILIPPQSGDDADIYGGHHFQADYLAGAASRIVSDINVALHTLQAGDSNSSVSCFTPPSLGLAYDVQKIAFAATDPTAVSIDKSMRQAGEEIASASRTLASVNTVATNLLNATITNLFFSVFPRPNAQNAGTVFAVEKTLYGSSLSEEDYQSLLQGADLPEDNAAPAAPATSSRTPPQTTQTSAQSVPQSKPSANPSVQTSHTSSPTIDNPNVSAPSPVLSSPSPSPGFGGGAAPLQSVLVLNQQYSSDAVNSNTDSQANQAPSTPDQNDIPILAATSSVNSNSSIPDTSNASSSIATPTIPTLADFEPSCAAQALQGQGYFFSDQKDDVTYENGFLTYHFQIHSEYADARPFTLIWSYYDDECNSIYPFYPPTISIMLPRGSAHWSVRFSSPTHFDVWDDDGEVIVGDTMVPNLPNYASIRITARIDGGASSMASRIVKIQKDGAPPIGPDTANHTPLCTGMIASGYLFDSYEHAEYVQGLLRIHLRTLAPYEDGFGFRSAILLPDSDCSFTLTSFGSGSVASTVLPNHMRYFSLRMTSPTHWQLWDDDRESAIACPTCEGDIPEHSPYLGFYANADWGGSILQTDFYPPTSSL